jgi:hypothetical protein
MSRSVGLLGPSTFLDTGTQQRRHPRSSRSLLSLLFSDRKSREIMPLTSYQTVNLSFSFLDQTAGSASLPSYLIVQHCHQFLSLTNLFSTFQGIGNMIFDSREALVETLSTALSLAVCFQQAGLCKGFKSPSPQRY